MNDIQAREKKKKKIIEQKEIKVGVTDLYVDQILYKMYRSQVFLMASKARSDSISSTSR